MVLGIFEDAILDYDKSVNEEDSTRQKDTSNPQFISYK